MSFSLLPLGLTGIQLGCGPILKLVITLYLLLAPQLPQWSHCAEV